jgi:hypothetical protein
VPRPDNSPAGRNATVLAVHAVSRKVDEARAFAAEVDELGALEKEFAPLRPKLARIELLRSAIRARYDDSPAATPFTAEGAHYSILIGARGNVSTINVLKLIKAIGLKAFASFATVTLTALKTHVACGVVATVVSVAAEGQRSLKTFEKGSTS